jgi:hypothetical protein
MRFCKPILMAVLVIALAAYAFDCGAITTPEQAMQCCASMPCAPHGHDGQDCCKSMPSMHAPFVQSAAVHSPSHARTAVAVLTAFDAVNSTLAEVVTPAMHSHGPPQISPTTRSPLRI